MPRKMLKDYTLSELQNVVKNQSGDRLISENVWERSVADGFIKKYWQNLIVDYNGIVFRFCR